MIRGGKGGVGFLLRQKARNALMGCKPMSLIMIVARFGEKLVKWKTVQGVVG